MSTEYEVTLSTTSKTKLTNEEILRGEKAARELLQAHCISAKDAFNEFSQFMENNIGTNENMREFIWVKAEDAAFSAACDGWKEQAEDLELEPYEK